MEIRVYYEDTDCGGVVYYANDLKYFERARTQYLEDHGISVSKLWQDRDPIFGGTSRIGLSVSRPLWRYPECGHEGR